MKKKLMFLAVVALFLSGGVFTAMQLTKKEKVSGLTLDNIEAMTQRYDEDGARPSTCTFTKVKKNQANNTLICKGSGGSLCCTMD